VVSSSNVHERTFIDGWHKCLGHPSLKIVHHLVKHFSLPISSNKTLSSLCHSRSIIKHINNPFMLLISKVMSHLNLFTLMCGVPLVIPNLMDQDIISFLYIIIQNIHDFIQWSLNLVSLLFFRISKNLLKLVFKSPSKHYTLTMVGSSSL
jgi:hypothetical protein